MEEPNPQWKEEEDPVRTCAYTGERRPESQMVRIGRHYVLAEYKDAAVKFLQEGNEFEPAGTEMETPPVLFMPLLTKSWEIFRQNWLLFLLIDVTVAVPLHLLDEFVAERVNAVEQEKAFSIFSTTLNGIFGSVGYAAIFAAMSRLWSGKVPTYGNAWFVTMAQVGNVVLAGCLVTAMVSLGTLMFIIPGIIASVWLAFTLCIVIDEGRGAWSAVERSTSLAQGRFWPILGYLMAVSLPLSIPLQAYDLLSRRVPFYNHWALDALLLAVLGMFLVFAEVFTFVLYRALRSASTRANS